MKHLLIILSIILISSPVIGNETGVLYLYESSSGILWKEFGDKETDPIYKGDVEQGRPNGVGVMTFPDGRKYVGENKDGFPNGQGTMTWSNGVEYVGEYKDGKPNGQGTMTYSDGEKCVGRWQNVGFRNGRCYYKNGTIQYKYVNGKRIKQYPPVEKNQ